VNNFVFSAVHRLPGGSVDAKNIIVRFNSLGDRDRSLNASGNLKGQKGLAVMSDLPPNLSKLRSELLTSRYNMPPNEHKLYKLKQLKEAPFLKLVKRQG
jgi:hypothetical protein